MVTIQETEKMLDELAEELPQDFYRELNGGIMLVPDLKRSPVEGEQGLFIMGEYHRNPTMGRYIIIYYGSFMQVYGYLGAEVLKVELRKTLRHEFRHHMESLAGERGLEYEDARFINDYMKKQKRQQK